MPRLRSDNIHVLVTGGRDYENAERVYAALDYLHRYRGIACIIQGNSTGADCFARRWANRRGVQLKTFPAEWRALGRAAGPIRNSLMLDESKPDLVLAFPGNEGTADMVRKALFAGVPVTHVKDKP